MMGIFIVIVVGLFVASIVAFAANVLIPSTNSTATEDRLSAMASRGRAKLSDTAEAGSLLMGGWEEDNHPLAKLVQNMPALADYLDRPMWTLQKAAVPAPEPVPARR